MAEEVVNMDHCQQLAKIVEKITTSGMTVLVPEDMKILKRICKQSDAYVKHCFYLVMTRLEKDHAEIRLSSFLIIDEIFNRSHCFRDLLLKDFQNFLELTLETDPEIPLPPPKQAANILKYRAMRAIHQWHTKFGDTYKKLSLGYNFLKHCKKIDFEGMVARSEADRRQRERSQQKAELLEKKMVENATEQMKEMKKEIVQCMIQAENCMRLLLPEPESFNIYCLKSPDPHSGGNPWTNSKFRRKSAENRRKSVDSSQVKSSKNRCPDQKLQKYTAVSDSDDFKNTNVKIKEEKIEDSLCCTKDRNTSSQDSMASTKTCSYDSKDFKNTNIKIKEEKIEPGSDNMQTTGSPSSCVRVKSESELHSATTESSSSVKVKSQADLHSTTCSSSSNHKVDEEENSDDFQEITDSSPSSNEDSETEGEGQSYDEDEMLPISRHMDLVRSHGLGSRQFNMDIALQPEIVHIDETEDNEDIINALRDSVQLAQNKFLPSLQKWIEIFTKAGNTDQIRRVLDIKNVLTNMTEKVGKLKFVRNKRVKSQQSGTSVKEENDDSDDDFEEVVEKEGYEANIPEHLREEYGLVEKPVKPPTRKEWSFNDREDTTEDPASSSATLAKLQQSKVKDEPHPGVTSKLAVTDSESKGKPTTSASSSGSQRDLLKKAPYVPFNMDLIHWGEKIEAPLVVKFESASRFWCPQEEGDVVDKNALSSMTSRVISFAGKFEPVSHQCRAPLPSGKLCPRKDRVKCPFHGKIVPRDAVGEPVSAEDKLREEQKKEEKQQESVPDWEDPELQQAIQAATGIDVSRKAKGKGKGKGKGKRKNGKRNPDLTDIGPQPKTSRGRLESKVLNARAIKRVSATLDSLDSKRHRDKFGNQFHYSLKESPRD